MVGLRRKRLESRGARCVRLICWAGQACAGWAVRQRCPGPCFARRDDLGLGSQVEMGDGRLLLLGEEQELWRGRLGGEEEDAAQTEGMEKGQVGLACADEAPARDTGRNGGPGGRRMDLGGLGHGAGLPLAPGAPPRACLRPRRRAWRRWGGRW